MADEQGFPQDFGLTDLKEVEALDAKNVFFAQADAENVPVGDEKADIALSINIADRLSHGPEKAIRECFRILRPGGWFIFSDPLNWAHARFWNRYGNAHAVLALIEKTGFRIVTWFDDLRYREINDGRGFVQELSRLVACATKLEN